MRNMLVVVWIILTNLLQVYSKKIKNRSVGVLSFNLLSSMDLDSIFIFDAPQNSFCLEEIHIFCKIASVDFLQPESIKCWFRFSLFIHNKFNRPPSPRNFRQVIHSLINDKHRITLFVLFDHNGCFSHQLNIIIAMMSSTYKMRQIQNDEIWKINIFSRIIRYEKQFPELWSTAHKPHKVFATDESGEWWKSDSCLNYQMKAYYLFQRVGLYYCIGCFLLAMLLLVSLITLCFKDMCLCSIWLAYLYVNRWYTSITKSSGWDFSRTLPLLCTACLRSTFSVAFSSLFTTRWCRTTNIFRCQYVLCRVIHSKLCY